MKALPQPPSTKYPKSDEIWKWPWETPYYGRFNIPESAISTSATPGRCRREEIAASQKESHQ